MLRLEVSYRGLLLAALALLSLYALVKLWPVVVLVITAFIFMAALQPYVTWLVSRGMPRTFAVLAIFAGIVAIIAGLMTLMVPAMIDEFADIRTNLPDYARTLEDFLADYGMEADLEKRAEDFQWGDLVSGSEAVNYGQRIVFTVLSLFTILVLSIYLLIDTPRLSRFAYQFVPSGREPEFEAFLQSLSRVVGGYVRGQAITSVCIAVYTFLVLLILGVPNAIAFAVLAGFVDVIPLIGAFIATIPPVVAAFDVSPTLAIWVLIALLIYQQFEDRYLTPRIYGQTLNLPPLIVLLAILAGGQLLGITGVLLALPAAAVGRVALDYMLDRRAGSVAPPGPAGEPLAPDSE